MALPSNFDPRRLTLDMGNTVRNIMPTPIQTSNRHYRSYRSSWWEDVNDIIGSIGEWIQETGSSAIALIITLIPTLYVAFCVLRWNISVFSDDGFFLGVLSFVVDFFVIGIGYYVFMIIYGVLFAILFLVGYVFYNAYTFLIALALGVFFCVKSCNTSYSYSVDNEIKPTQQYIPPTVTYICTAQTSLKVRSSPSTNSSQIGSLKHGEEIEVLGFKEGFAHIKFDGRDAYVSSKYIVKK